MKLYKLALFLGRRCARGAFRIRKYFWLVAAPAVALCLCACSEPGGDDGGGGISLPIDGSGGRHYYNLSTGQRVAVPSGGNWDIALDAHDGAFFILTNSGVTAADLGAGASGLGGVWFTESTDFGAVHSAGQRVIPDAGDEYYDYTKDVTRYAMVMAAEPAAQTMNVITYLGYPAGSEGYPLTGSGDGTSAVDCFRRTTPDMSNMAAYVPYLFNKRQAYSMKGMPPDYTPTGRVYIVRHGDGAGFSKLQVREVYLESGSPSRFVLYLRYEGL